MGFFTLYNCFTQLNPFQFWRFTFVFILHKWEQKNYHCCNTFVNVAEILYASLIFHQISTETPGKGSNRYFVHN